MDHAIIFGGLGTAAGVVSWGASQIYRALPEGTARTIVESGHTATEVLFGVGALALAGGLVKLGIDMRRESTE
jgi:hypothetical protein